MTRKIDVDLDHCIPLYVADIHTKLEVKKNTLGSRGYSLVPGERRDLCVKKDE